jgi:hypothetical protein
MGALFDSLDVFTYGAAIIGGLLAVLWIYNSTIKERRGILRRARSVRDPALERLINQGAFLQRLGFSVAAVVTGIGILWFARGYHNKYHVDISSAYVILAGVLITLGTIGALVSYIFRRKE